MKMQNNTTTKPLNQNRMKDENYKKLKGIRDIVFAVLVGGGLLAISFIILTFKQ